MPGRWTKVTRAALRATQSAWLRRAVLVSALAALLVTAVARRGDLMEAIRSVGPGGIVLACLAVAASIVAQWLAWHRCLTGLGSAAPPRTTIAIFLLSLPGKYLPGGVWTTMLQVEHGARAAIDRPRSLGASLLSMLTTLVVGALLGLGFLLDETADVPFSWMLPALLVPGLALLMPPVQLRVTGWLRRFGDRAGRPVALPIGATLAAVGWNVIGWILLGAHIVVLADGAVPLHRATAAFALSWTLGFLFLVAPAGAGIRDVALAATLGASLGDGSRVAIALLSRAVVTLVDVVLAGATVAIVWRSARADRDDQRAVTSAR